MPISYAIRQMSGVVLSHGSGGLSDNDFHDHHARLRFDGHFQSYFDEICDLRGVTRLVTSREAFHAVALASPFERCARRVYIVRPCMAAMLSRHLCALDDLPAGHRAMARTAEDAERWLRRRGNGRDADVPARLWCREGGRKIAL